MFIWPTSLLLCVVLVGALAGCDQSTEIVVPPAPKDPLAATPLTLPETLDLTRPGDPAKQVQLTVSEPERWGHCQPLLETAGKPAQTFPYQGEPALAAEAFFGCGLQAHTVAKDGRRFLVYALEAALPGAKPRNLQLVAYDASGELRWSHRFARSSKSGADFVASHRDTFIADLAPHLVCTGSLWESGIDVECVREESGELAWNGRLPYWSGIAPQGLESSLFVADLSGLRQIYPWSGVERHFQKLDGPGGRASFYETDGSSLYFSSNRQAPVTLSAHDFSSMKRRWSRTLPWQLDATVSAALPEHGLIVARHQEELVGIDTRDGSARWVVATGDHTPKIAAGPKSALILVRREEAPNLLFALDPRSGEVRWWSEPPTGTLRFDVESGVLLLGSVRTIQRAPLPPQEQ